MLSALLTTFVLLGSPVGRNTQAFCPAEHERHRASVEMFLTHASAAEERNTAGLNGFGTDQVRVLTDGADSVACQWFASKFNVPGTSPNWRWTAYQVGSRYVVSFHYFPPPGSHRLGLTPLLVFDVNFNQTAGIAF